MSERDEPAATDDRVPPPDVPDRPPESAAPAGPIGRRVTQRVTSALGGAADHLESAASAVGAAVGAAGRRFDERPGARVRRVRRMGSQPLPYLFDAHPEARHATPRGLGIRTIDVADIAGTAVGGLQQRGGDFLPLKPFRSANWHGRWQRLGRAAKSLAILPPIDVQRYADRYWVIDGHNRVGMALYTGQAAIDADVTDLVDPAAARTEPAESFASFAEDSRELRSAVSRTARGRTAPGRRPASRSPSDPRPPDETQ